MKQGNAESAGERPGVRRVSATRAESGYVAGELNVGGVPCEVIYPDPETRSNVVRPMSLRAESSGSFQWDPAVSGPAGASALRQEASERGLAHREQSSLPIVQYGAASDPQGEIVQHGGDLHKLHQLLRGRYILAFVLAALLSIAGIWAGLHFGYKTFQSTGLVTITPIHLFPSQDNSQSIEQFMLAQTAKFKAQRVLDRALEDKDWRKLDIALPSDFEVTFAKDLEVTPQGQMLLVKFAHRDKDAATTAVRTSMRAFQALFDDEQTTSGNHTTAKWTTARNDLNNKLSSIQRQIDDLAGMYGSDGLNVRRDIELQELHEVESGINALQLMQVQIAADAKGAAAPASGVPIEEIAKVDPLLQNLLGRQSQLQQQVAEISAEGAMEKLPRLRTTKALLDSVEDEIGKHAEDWRQTHITSRGSVAGATNNPLLQFLSPEEMTTKSKYFQTRKKFLEDELKGLSEQIGAISGLRIQKDRILKDLNTAEEELQQDEIEKTKWAADISDADRPLGAFRDTRITFAGVGGLGGIFVGFGVALLLGLLDQRVRDPRDAAGPLAGGPILGMLPELPDDLANPEQAAIASHSVHEIRTLLQIWGRGQNHQVFGITSCAPASGKTSLTLALGVSFASAKFKTLLIDCDLVGGGLSVRVDTIIRRKIGRVLNRAGHISEPQLQQALKLAHGSGRKVGEVLVELGYLTEEDLGAAIAGQADEQVGLLDALAGEPFDECVVETGIPGVWVLPLGRATARDAGTLSPDSLHRVIEVARTHFDIVLVDTGPIPASLEASITASLVDAVVMTVARGERGSDLQRSMTHLRSLSTRVAGIVFNRARRQDVDRYGSSGRSTSGGTGGGPSAKRRVDVPSSVQFGPVARAVAAFSVG